MQEGEQGEGMRVNIEKMIFPTDSRHQGHRDFPSYLFKATY